MTIESLVKKIKEGDKSSLAKSITLVCSHLKKDEKQTELLLKKILKVKKNSYRIGISGIGGVGKSTFVGVLGKFILEQNSQSKIAVLTIDPSSPKGGGSILGDGVRMGELSSDERAFVRSLANQGLSGGVTHQVQEILCLLEAAGYDYILVESVGAGQSDSSIAYLCDAFIHLQMPASGDAVQAIKKGSGELADFIVVHKNDGILKHDAERTKVFYEQAHSLQKLTRQQNLPEVLLVSSIEKTGIKELWNLVLKKKSLDSKQGFLEKRREEQLFKIFKEQVASVFQKEIFNCQKFSKDLGKIREDLVKQKTSPLLAARELVDKALSSRS